jgi:hypothetical protein
LCEEILSHNLPMIVIIASLLTALAGLSPVPQAQVRNTVRLAGDYVQNYHDTLTTIVADEVYVQRVDRSSGAAFEERTLKSEFAIVRGDGDEEAYAIRDVREVDGHPVSERAAMDALLRAPRGRLRSAALAMAIDQMKYNLGNVYRTINVPTLPLMFLLPDRQHRFRFRSGGSAAMPGMQLAVVTYEERDRPTIIRTPSGRSVVARGTLWIEALNGRVWKTELVTNEPRGLKAVVSVIYGHEARLNLLVPTTMHESYETRDERITATATYSNYRRFETDARIVR